MAMQQDPMNIGGTHQWQQEPMNWKRKTYMFGLCFSRCKGISQEHMAWNMVQ